MFALFRVSIVMGTKAVTIHKRLRGGAAPVSSNAICKFWKEGNCKRNPCWFLHGEPQRPNVYRRGRTLIVDRPGKNANHSPGNSLFFAGRLGVSECKVMKKKGNVNQPRLEFVCGASGTLILTDGCGMAENNSVQAAFDHGIRDLPRKHQDTNKTDCGNGSEAPRKHQQSRNSSLLTTGSAKPEGRTAEERPRSGLDASCLRKIRSCLQHTENRTTFSAVSSMETAVLEDNTSQKSVAKVCELWMSGKCVEGDRCQSLHSWFQGDGFSMLAKLGGHDQVISGIALPSGSDKLYSGSHDGTVRIWDCHTGQSSKVVNLGDKVGSLVSEGPWVFVGMPNVVKAWNTETGAEFSLDGAFKQVYAIIVALDMLFAGSQDGAIVVWKGSSEKPNPFQLVAYLKGHTGAVTCLAVGAMRLYSGSVDGTIRVWDLYNLQCISTLNVHKEAVMSLIFCNQYLLSCSLDKTIKVWVTTESGNLEVTYSHVEEHGVLALCGVMDGEARPILLCSCIDNSVHLHELPSFTDRGRLFSKQEVREIQNGPSGLFFTGDASGMLNVWKMA